MKLLFSKTILYLFICSLFACTSGESHTLTIAASANMRHCMQQLVKSFTAQTGINCQTVVSSSGKLTAQIMQGAPYDVFVSADMNYPQELHTAGFTDHPPKVYAFGKLILWTLSDSVSPGLQQLVHTSVDNIAVANPKTAPYGIAAIEALRRSGIYQKVKHKLVYGESISQTSQFVVSGVAQAGLTAKSVVMTPQMKTTGHWIEVDPDLYTPIKQGAVIIKRSGGNEENAAAFYRFLYSEPARIILAVNGYQPPANE